MVDQETAAAVLLGCGAASWGITALVWRVLARREVRRNCNHRMVTDPCGGWNATLRCSLGCGHQEPDREYVARYQADRQTRIEAAAIKSCPRCGGEING